MLRFKQFSILHLLILTTIVGISTPISMSYILMYGTTLVIQSVSGGIALTVHLSYVALLFCGLFQYNRIPRNVALPALLVEFCGMFFTFGRFGVVGFHISMACFMIASFILGFATHQVLIANGMKSSRLS